MKDTIFILLSICQEQAQNEADNFDTLLSDYDDGENINMSEARRICLNYLDNSIQRLNDTRKDIQSKSLKQLRKEYHI